MKPEQRLAQAIKTIALNQTLPYVPATVKQINKINHTATVQLTHSGLTVSDVLLNARTQNQTAGLVLYPKTNSTVLVGQTNPGQYAVLMYSEIDELLFENQNTTMQLSPEGITLNHGQNGGLVNWPLLQTELTKITTYLQTLTTALQAAVPAPTDGGAAIKTALLTALSSLPTANFSQIENKKVTH